METMRYNKVNNSKLSIGMFTFLFFIFVGSGAVFYMIKNEPKPVVLGEDPLKQVLVYEEEKVDLKAIKYEVKTNTINNGNGKFKASISIPKFYIDSVELAEINKSIYDKFNERYTSVKNEAAADLENNFTYKVTYKTYENNFEDARVISVTIYERIVDDKSGKEVRSKLYTVNVNLESKSELEQEDAAHIALGTNYRNLIKEQIKEYVISKGMIKSSNYKYSITGLEEFYIKENVFHVIFNPGEIVDNKYDYLDIVINKEE